MAPSTAGPMTLSSMMAFVRQLVIVSAAAKAGIVDDDVLGLRPDKESDYFGKILRMTFELPAALGCLFGGAEGGGGPLLGAGWMAAGVFVLAEVLALALVGDSFFGMATGGVVESVRSGLGTLVMLHIVGGAIMWANAFVQVAVRPLRKAPLAVVHRVFGRAMLLNWFFVTGPSCWILSLFTGIGPHRQQFASMVLGVMLMDVTLMASYFFWRGFQIARVRSRGEASLALHGRAMRLGTMMTMVMLLQRPLQLFFILVRKALLLAMLLVPESWLMAHGAAQYVTTAIFDHNVLLALSTMIGGGYVLVVLIDGPRAHLASMFVCPNLDEAEDFYGSPTPSRREMMFWRSRYFVYVGLRAIVTRGFAVDPVTGV